MTAIKALLVTIAVFLFMHSSKMLFSLFTNSTAHNLVPELISNIVIFIFSCTVLYFLLRTPKITSKDPIKIKFNKNINKLKYSAYLIPLSFVMPLLLKVFYNIQFNVHFYYATIIFAFLIYVTSGYLYFRCTNCGFNLPFLKLGNRTFIQHCPKCNAELQDEFKL